MIGPVVAVLLALVTTASVGVGGVNNGAARLPPLGWSTWNTFRYTVSDQLIREAADAMISSGLAKAGYEYVLIDDGWTECAEYNPNGGCAKQPTPPRTPDGRIKVDMKKFPYGFRPLANYVHGKGLKLGIYTAVSNATCGGFISSLGYERIDAQSFSDWGFDFVKSDTCNSDCSIHDGCIQSSTLLMSQGLNATGSPIVYYIDDGNDSSGPRVYNPFMHRTNQQQFRKIAAKPDELVWNWGPLRANMWKLWFDHGDDWWSTLDNIRQQAALPMYQSCGAFNMPDMVTIGQGNETPGMYRAQMFLWSLMSSPILIGADVRKLDNVSLALLTAPEVLAIDQDPECVQGSYARGEGGGEVWIKPLSNGDFAAVLFNTALTAQDITIILNDDHENGDFYPAYVDRVRIRNAFTRTDVGVYSDRFVHRVPAQDAAIFRITPL